jgi:tetratricopeptide (TPR) repeat protein
MFGARSPVAERYLDTALQLFQHMQDTIGMAATYNNIGVLLQRDPARFRESILAFEQALPLFQKLGNLEGMGSALNYMALSYWSLRNFQKAIEYLLQGLEVRKKIKDVQGAMFSLTIVGDMYHALGQSDTALKYYREALDLAREKKAEPLTDTYAALAKLHMESKQYEIAKKYIDLSLKGNLEWYYLLLGRYYSEIGAGEGRWMCINR